MNIKIILLKLVYHTLIRALDGRNYFLMITFTQCISLKKIYSQSSLHVFTDKHCFKPQNKICYKQLSILISMFTFFFFRNVCYN